MFARLAMLTVFVFSAAVLIPGSPFPARCQAQLTGGEPNHPVTLMVQGIQKYRTGKFAEAAVLFRQLTLLDSRHLAGHYYLGISEAKNGADPEALRALERAVHLGHDALSFPKDGELTEAFKRPKFRAGVDRLVKIAQNRAKGVLLPFEFDLSGRDTVGEEYDLTDRKGQCVAVLFYDVDTQKGVEALYFLEPIVSEYEGVEAVGVIKAKAKTQDMRQRKVANLHRESTLGYPMLTGEPEWGWQLRPFRVYPTLVVIDKEGRAQRIVEGFPADWEARYRAAIQATLHPPKVKPEGASDGGAPASQPANGKPATGKPEKKKGG